jgi:hypothetical protein
MENKMANRIIKLMIVLLATFILILLFTNKDILSQTIDIGDGAEMNIGTGADICTGIIGNITGNITGTGTNCTQPMPVELISFSASVNKDVATLHWQTASEENNLGFQIFRSVKNDKTEWYKVGFVSGSGTRHTTTNYSFSESKLKAGKYFYRLRQIDYNGNMQYFELNNIVEIKPPGKFELFQNYPNPFNPTTKINFTLSNDTKVSLIVYDMSGREINTIINKTLSADYYTVEFNASNLASGVYFYRLVTNEFTSVKKMVILK